MNFIERHVTRGGVRGIAAFVALVVVPGADLAQTRGAPDKGLESYSFDVASIRRSDDWGFAHQVRISFEEDSYLAENVTLRMLIAEAYGIHERLILGGPAWLDKDSYNIEARIGSNTVEHLNQLDDAGRLRAQRDMLRGLLAERFSLELTEEDKEAPVWFLIRDRGVKMVSSKPGQDYTSGSKDAGGQPMGPHSVSYSFYLGDVRMVGQSASVGLLIDRLTQNAEALQLDREIFDRTGLVDNYDFTLHLKVPWPPGRGSVPSPDKLDKLDNAYASPELSIFRALPQQLGLKLVAGRAPVRFIHVNNADKASTN